MVYCQTCNAARLLSCRPREVWPFWYSTGITGFYREGGGGTIPPDNNFCWTILRDTGTLITRILILAVSTHTIMRTWVQCKNGQSARLPRTGCMQRITINNCSAVEPNGCCPVSIIRRQALSGAIALGTTTLLAFSATATGLEAIDLPGSSFRTVNEARMQENRGE